MQPLKNGEGWNATISWQRRKPIREQHGHCGCGIVQAGFSYMIVWISLAMQLLKKGERWNATISQEKKTWKGDEWTLNRTFNAINITHCLMVEAKSVPPHLCTHSDSSVIIQGQVIPCAFISGPLLVLCYSSSFSAPLLLMLKVWMGDCKNRNDQLSGDHAKIGKSISDNATFVRKYVAISKK